VLPATGEDCKGRWIPTQSKHSTLSWRTSLPARLLHMPDLTPVPLTSLHTLLHCPARGLTPSQAEPGVKMEWDAYLPPAAILLHRPHQSSWRRQCPLHHCHPLLHHCMPQLQIIMLHWQARQLQVHTLHHVSYPMTSSWGATAASKAALQHGCVPHNHGTPLPSVQPRAPPYTAAGGPSLALDESLYTCSWGQPCMAMRLYTSAWVHRQR
jgi:hypothetical protein